MKRRNLLRSLLAILVTASVLMGVWACSATKQSGGPDAKQPHGVARRNEQLTYAPLDLEKRDGAEGRLSEWRDNANSQAIRTGDKSIQGVDGVESVWTSKSGDWRGNLVWGDNHTKFEQSARGFTTRYQAVATTNDNLFAGTAVSAGGDKIADSGSNALMTYDGGDGTLGAREGQRAERNARIKAAFIPAPFGVARPNLNEEVWVIARNRPAPGNDAGGNAAQPVNDDIPGSGAIVAEIADKDGKVTQVPVPLKHTKVRAGVVGYLGAVDVTQQFHNPYEKKIEAVYVFPLPENSAVNEFVMIVGDRKIRGIIREREEAKKVYEAAKEQGYVASMMTQERPNVFTQRVANIEPGKRIDVSVRYYQTLACRDGWYEFTFPMVVGPRYNPSSLGDKGIGAVANGDAGASGQKNEVQYLRPNERSGHDIDLTVDVNAGVPITAFECKNHKIVTEKGADATRATVSLAGGDKVPNKDFALRWKVAGDRIQTSFVKHRDERGGYFTLMLYPPADLAKLEREPMEMVFLVDVSGSMSGQPIARVKEGLKAAIAAMDKRDTFQVVTFAGSAERVTEKPVRPTAENVAAVMAKIDAMQAGGGTEMLKGIQESLKRTDATEDRRRMIALMTDGYIGNESEIIMEVAKADRSTRFFSFGVGTSVNAYLIEGVARAGRGAMAYVSLNEDATQATRQYVDRVSHPAMTDIQIDFGGMKVADVHPKKLPDLFVGRPVVLVGRYEGNADRPIKVTGKVGGKTVSFEVAVNGDAAKLPVPKKGDGAATTGELNPAMALPAIWARGRIADVADYATEKDDEKVLTTAVKNLALEYSLMSEFTSFVAVDTATKTGGEAAVAAPVPVPVPEGVSFEKTVSER